LSGSLQSLLALREPEFLLKAKSDVSLACTTSQSISMDLSSGGLAHAVEEIGESDTTPKARYFSNRNLMKLMSFDRSECFICNLTRI
jgi:hypothetical protein